MIAPVLIFAIGNESRGDDALGPLLLRELDAWLKANALSDQFELQEDFQLQVEHAMDMRERQLVLFIDAGMDTRAPFDFYRAQTSDTQVLYSHALAPEALLKVYAQFYQESAQDVFILCVCGERFELGEGLSHPAVERLALAFEFCKKLLQTPEGSIWESLCMQKTVGELMSREDNLHSQARC
jgi:hydrogenase maturation protease